ncbi:MAG: pyruvate ferredoxin oxidoreductase, partial [Prevotella sp.]|nr:pyruvate ferredoxin oxidoreductase [Prevotella sp.]
VRLDEEFDRRMLKIIESEKTVKAKTITLSQRLTPLFRAAAVIAIFLTLGTAAQRAISTDNEYPTADMQQSVNIEGPSVAVNDSVKKDSAKIVQAPLIIE